MNPEVTIFAKAIINSFAQDMGNALGPLNLFIKKIQRGQPLSNNEIIIMSNTYKKFESALNNYRKMARDNFKGVSIESDKLGLCFYLKKK